MESNLPNFEEMVAQHTVRIERLRLGDMTSSPRTLKLNTVTAGSSIEQPITVELYELNDDRVRGYLPSKVWYRDPGYDVDERCYGDHINMVFYTSGAFPDIAKPFGTGKAWMCVVPIDDYTTVTYPVGTRIFIDQIQTPTVTLYTFVFGEDAYDDIVISDPRPGSQELELSCLDLYGELIWKEDDQ